MPLLHARPEGKSLQGVPLLTSTDKGHGACLPAASSWSWTGFLKRSCGGVSCAVLTEQRGQGEGALRYSPFLHRHSSVLLWCRSAAAPSVGVLPGKARWRQSAAR